jgi:hypothetical protein
LNADAVATFSIPSAPQNLAAAGGRSIDTQRIAASRSAARSLKVRTDVAQIPVSSEGKMFNTTARPARSADETALKSDLVSV